MLNTLTMHMHIEWNPVLTFWWDVDGGIPRPGSHGQQEEREQKSSVSPPAAHLLLWHGRHCTCWQAQHNGQENLWLSQSEKGNRHGFFFLYVSLRFTPSWCTLTAREERVREWGREGQEGRLTCVEKNHSDLHMAQDRGSQKDERQRTEWQAEEERGVELGAQ